MDIIAFREYVLSLPFVEESTPFDKTTLVYKIGNKMFACASMEQFDHFAVKCDPELAIELRERYAGVTPAWHFNKRHWNDIYIARGLSLQFIKEQLFAAYMLVATKSVTPKSYRLELLSLIEEALSTPLPHPKHQ